MESLTGQLGLDTRPFTRAIRGAKGAVGPAAKDIGNEFSKTFAKYVGVREVIGLFKDQIRNAVEIKKESAKLGVDPETFQRLKALSEETGISIEELTEKIVKNADASEELKTKYAGALAEIEKTHAVIKTEDIEQLAQAWEKVQQIFVKLAPAISGAVSAFIKLYDIGSRAADAAVAGGMSLVGDITRNKDLSQAGREMGKEAFGGAKTIGGAFGALIHGTGEPAPAAEKSKVSEFAAAFAKETKKEDKKEGKKDGGGYGSRVSSDSLTRVGGYVRGGPMMKQESEQTKILRLLRRDVNDLALNLRNQLSS